MSRLALWPTQPPIQWVLQDLSLGVKQAEREADHSIPSGADVTNAWSYMSTHPYIPMAWCLIRQGICLHGVVPS